MKLKLIAAVARNRVIGKDNALPWHLPEDLAFFKRTTMGCPVVMGRKTWDSIGRPLPGRLNVVLTRNTEWQPALAPDGTVRPFVRYPEPLQADTKIAIADGLETARLWLSNLDTVFLIGGANLYEQALQQNQVDELILTEIDNDFEGDASFPHWSKDRFQEVGREHNPPSDDRAWGFDFVQYRRID